MSITPTMVPALAVFRGPSSSKDYNQTQRAAQADIVAAYAALQAANAKTLLDNEVLSGQNEAASTAIVALRDQVAALQALYTSLRTFGSSAGGTNTVTMVAGLHDADVSYGGFPSYYPAGAPLSTASRALYSPDYGQIMPSLSIAPLSKAYVADLITGGLVYPPGVAQVANTTVTPSLAPYLVEENDVALAVDGLASSTWRRNVYFPTNVAVSDVSTTVTLTLPEQYVNNLVCNYVTIHPYPEFGVDVTSVVLRGTGGAADTQLLQTNSSGIVPLSGAAKTRLIFPDQQVVSIDITLRQSTPNLNLRPGLQCFSLGAAVLDFGYLTFNRSASKVLVPFALGNNFFQLVSAVGPSVAGVTYRLYYLDPAGDLVSCNIGDTLPGFVRTVYVEATLTPSSGVLPVLTQLQLQFLPVYLVN